MLALDDVRVAYGNVEVLRGVSLHVAAGELVCLIGANGAGKTTTAKTISGLLRPRGGRVTFLDSRIDGRPAHEILKLGIAHCPEGRRIFPDMTVRENLEMGAFVRGRAVDIAQDLDRVLERFPVLRQRARQLGGTLSGGEQQMLAIARALMANPKLLVLDEPSLGLSPTMVETTFQLIAEIRRQGVTVLMVEQNAYLALRMADRGYVMETGRTVLEGPARTLLENEHVRRAYLGG
ncbi:MAG TPA: ABC transporter ATP-binding protein [Methylomirabilota bacterium]|jgi:branched-chain amino acid transport system ATP-binding protein|nr:ABC transporter ATP-binding protein [Methylomirabilota bacterium]